VHYRKTFIEQKRLYSKSKSNPSGPVTLSKLTC